MKTDSIGFRPGKKDVEKYEKQTRYSKITNKFVFTRNETYRLINILFIYFFPLRTVMRWVLYT